MELLVRCQHGTAISLKRSVQMLSKPLVGLNADLSFR